MSVKIYEEELPGGYWLVSDDSEFDALTDISAGTPATDEISIAEADKAVQAMLGLSKLPAQRMPNGKPKEHQQRIAIGDEGAKAEFIARRFRMAYMVAQQNAAEVPSAETTVEDYFQDAVEAMLKGIIGHQAGTISDIDLDKTISTYVHRDVKRAVNKRGLIVNESYYAGRKRNKPEKESEPNLSKVTSDPLVYYDTDVVLGVEPEKQKTVKKTKIQSDHSALEYEELVDLDLYAETLAGESDTFREVAERLNAAVLNKMLMSKGVHGHLRQIMIMRYGLNGQVPEILEDVGTHFSVSRERIRQIENRMLSWLASMSKNGSFVRDELDNEMPKLKQNWREQDRAAFLSRNRKAVPDNSHRQTIAYRNEGLIEETITEEFDKLTGLISYFIVRVTNDYASRMQNGNLSYDFKEVKREVEDRYFSPSGYELKDRYFDDAIGALRDKGIIKDTQSFNYGDSPQYVETFSLAKYD